MRDLRRPAAHPLVELMHDLRDALVQAEPDGTTTPRTRLYQRVHGTLQSARWLVDSLELLVAELEAQSDGVTGEPAMDQEADDDDFQRIAVR
jgi:hypothetical protein